MEKQFSKVDAVTLKEVRTPEAVEPKPVEQNFDLEYLTLHKDELVEKRKNTVSANAAALKSVDDEIAENEELIAKCEDLGIIKKSDVVVNEIIK